MNILGISEARNNLPQLVDEVDENLSQLFITKNGRPKAVLISTEEFESWVETIASYSDPETMRIHNEIKSAKSAKDLKNVISLEKLIKSLNWK